VSHSDVVAAVDCSSLESAAIAVAASAFEIVFVVVAVVAAVVWAPSDQRIGHAAKSVVSYHPMNRSSSNPWERNQGRCGSASFPTDSDLSASAWSRCLVPN